MNKMKKKTKIVLWTVAVLIFLLLSAAAVFCFLFVSVEPGLKASELTDREYFTGAKIVQQVLYRTLRSKNSSEVKVLKISNREMHSLMKLAENGDSLLYLITGAKPKFANGKNEFYNIDYDGGIYTFTVKLTDTFWNLCFVARGQMKVFYTQGKLNIEFVTLKIGRFELTDNLKEKVKEKIYSYLKNEAAYDVVRAAVLKVDYLKSGEVRISYYPYRLRKYFKNMRF